jgi:hypothetical protein
MSKTPTLLVLIFSTTLLLSCAANDVHEPSILPTPALNAATSTAKEELTTFYFPIIAKNHPPPHIPLSNKKGLGYCNGQCPARLTCDELQALRITWGFTWGPGTPRRLADCRTVNGDPIEHIPMIWGMRDMDRQHTFPNSNSDYLLTFNEPEMYGQNNHIDPVVAASAWHTLETWYPDKKLIAPAVTVRYEWLDRMVEAYVGQYRRLPRFDALAGHCYPGTLGRCRTLVNFLTDRAQRWGVPEGHWINEYAYYAPTGWNLDQYLNAGRHLEQTTTYLENHPHVDRYAWFTAKYTGYESYVSEDWDSRLCYCNAHELTLLGQLYASIEPNTGTQDAPSRTEAALELISPLEPYKHPYPP